MLERSSSAQSGIVVSASRRGSTLGAIVDGEEADAEDNSANVPKIRDFMNENMPPEDNSKSKKKRQKKHRRHH